jgi:methylmalonyl-CoA mutase
LKVAQIMSASSPVNTAKPLLAEFPAVSFDDWRRLVEAELKGVPFDKKMFTETYEGIRLRPLYRSADVADLPHLNSYPGFAPFVRGARASGYVKRPWEVSQEIAVSSPTAFNDAARTSLGRGLNALNIVVDRATRNGQDPDWAHATEVGLGGLSIATLDDLDRALDGIDLDRTSLFVRSGASAMPFAALLIALARKRKKTPANLRGCIEMDPLGVLSHEGKLPQSMDGAYQEMASLTAWAAERAPNLQTICVHSRAWHEAGGSAVEELAFTLATAVEYLRQMNQRGLPVDLVAPRIRFAITVGEQFFTEISKLRALRMLWSHVISSLGGNNTSKQITIHARTSLWNKSVVDAYNNLLRGTVESFAAVLGGCDSLQVGAFDEVARPADDFSQRLARNTQLVLQKECQLTPVIDPAGGAWFVESLTAELASRAWGLFQEIEKMGGMGVALEKGFPQKTVAVTAEKKCKAAACRKDSIVGVNQYANPAEKPLDGDTHSNEVFHRRRVQQITSHRTSLDDETNARVLQRLSAVVGARGADLFRLCVEAVAAGATLGEITRAVRIQDAPGKPIIPVCITRVAVPFERLRAAMNRQPERARVFLCTMGSPKEHKARADFSRGFFGVGGYEVVAGSGLKSAGEAAEAFARANAPVAVICSTDENYPALVPGLVTELRSRKPDAVIVLAGYPADQVEAHRKSGVDEFIHVRADVLEVLARIHTKLGIA